MKMTIRNMCSIQLLLVYIFLLQAALHADVADISYLVADLKYSKEHGVKICEIQNGIQSTFFADLYLHGNRGLICPKIADVFAEFPIKKWMHSNDIAFKMLFEALKESGDWREQFSIDTIINDPAFQDIASMVPKDPATVSSYQGMIYATPKTLKKYGDFRSTYPGILVIDACTHAYWTDKYKMTKLFDQNPQLSQIKPEWGLYSKEYTPALAEQIIHEIPSDIFVIKPRGAFLGRGVIIVSKEDLDDVLQYILIKNSSLRLDKDKSFNHWLKDPHDSFIIEKYYPSDDIQVPAFEDKVFEPTMRCAFILIHDNKTIDFRFLGGYWMLPFKSIHEEGSLNELKKAYCKIPYFIDASETILEEVGKQLSATIPLLYQEMLGKNN